MPIEMRDVYSDSVNRIGHDPDTNELFVEWKKGKRSIYSDVPADKAKSVMSAWSVGKAIHSEIKPAHNHRYG